jgi:hypothetical protein
VLRLERQEIGAVDVDDPGRRRVGVRVESATQHLRQLGGPRPEIDTLDGNHDDSAHATSASIRTTVLLTRERAAIGRDAT